MKKLKKPYKKLFILCISIYVIYTLISQQKTLNVYKKEEQTYAKQIQQEQKNNQELNQIKENVNSTEYIEDVAREKLGMYLPNERIFYDIGN
ncbi:MAG: septum formation initiator family protein [Clostridia bacterium]|nr:septum formation initiator family protein [Clostridia bacterium]